MKSKDKSKTEDNMLMCEVCEKCIKRCKYYFSVEIEKFSCKKFKEDKKKKS